MAIKYVHARNSVLVEKLN